MIMKHKVGGMFLEVKYMHPILHLNQYIILYLCTLILCHWCNQFYLLEKKCND